MLIPINHCCKHYRLIFITADILIDKSDNLIPVDSTLLLIYVLNTIILITYEYYNLLSSYLVYYILHITYTITYSYTVSTYLIRFPL